MRTEYLKKLVGVSEFEVGEHLFDIGSEPSPEQKLLVAVLARAIMDAISPPVSSSLDRINGSTDSLQRAALEFFAWPGEEPYTYKWITDEVSSNPTGLRRKISQLLSSDNKDALAALYQRCQGARYRARTQLFRP